MTALQNTQFYMKNQVRARLAELADTHKGDYPFAVGDHFVLEFIDRPYRCTFSMGEGVLSVRLYIRSELGMYDENKGDVELTKYADLDVPMLRDFGRVENGEQLIQGYLQAAIGLGLLLREGNERDNFAERIPEQEGLLVKYDDGVFTFRNVAGEKRPSLLCTTLFDGDKLVRPYADEVSNIWQREEKSLEALLGEAEDGDEEAMTRVAAMLLQDDPREAARWYERLAEEDDAEGQFNLGLMLLRGMGVQRDSILALGWLERAAYNDHAAAQQYADACCRIVELEEGALFGDAHSMGHLAEEYMNLGRLLEDGEDLYAESLRLAEQAAAADVPAAMWVLGQCYELGLGVDEDTDRAVGYYDRGCALEHPGCLHAMGRFYLHGDYLIGDVDKGIAMCLRAAELGWGPAMLTMGDCYQFGDGVPSSMKTAVEWYERYLESHVDTDLEHQVAHIRSVAGLVDDHGMAAPFTMDEMEEDDPFAGFSIFSDSDPFANGNPFGGESFSETPEFGSTVPMFDDLIWTRLRAEAGDEEAIALLKALGEIV